MATYQIKSAIARAMANHSIYKSTLSYGFFYRTTVIHQHKQENPRLYILVHLPHDFSRSEALFRNQQKTIFFSMVKIWQYFLKKKTNFIQGFPLCFLVVPDVCFGPVFGFLLANKSIDRWTKKYLIFYLKITQSSPCTIIHMGYFPVWLYLPWDVNLVTIHTYPVLPEVTSQNSIVVFRAFWQTNCQ